MKNDVLRKVRYILDYGDNQMMNVFAAADLDVSRSQLSQWLKKNDDPDYQLIRDVDLAAFLNGLINEKRGKKDGSQLPPEDHLTNNVIFRKLTIAFDLRADDVIDVLTLADLRVSKHELSAFFRKPGHKNYRECKDQILRNFLHGLQLKYRS